MTHLARASATPAPVASEPDALAAALAARRQGTPVEIMADRTEYSQTFANPDGTSAAVVSAAPQWVRRGSSWAAADATLVQGSDGSWSPSAALGGLSLSGGGNQVLATLRSGGNWMSLSWPAALPAPSVSGATATYAEVFPGVDLAVTADTSGGFDETLVVKNQAAAADPQLADVSLGVSMSSGLSPHAASDGSAVMQAADGTAVFSSPPPLAWNSAAAGAGLVWPGDRHRPGQRRRLLRQGIGAAGHPGRAAVRAGVQLPGVHRPVLLGHLH